MCPIVRLVRLVRCRIDLYWMPTGAIHDLQAGKDSVASMSFGGLYWLAAAMALATATGLINSWVLLVEIKR
jgi:hypothetical protein